jgi:hypothetical protein
VRVVDFDWAGDAGKGYYPPSRNPDIVGLTWPGEPGGAGEEQGVKNKVGNMET